ncbi:ATP-binding protein [Streptomyces sp. ACA25]|uniref:ATP-binding protein n=1 Tax=Streptomyces sp. ACA25 TaxID=3022596 RepID=UPI0023071A74|nr:ATP-binding protein [Streptomyces sp. ACA25]MDB1090113.1 ATP-binding protein [Streptomyces sp. ACA25]
MPDNARHRFRVPAVDAAAAEARRRVLLQLSAWRAPVETCDNAQLVVSELVTNALRHTASRTVGCELEIMGKLLRVAVTGDGSGPTERPACATEDDEGGRGLLLVCALSEGWGVQPCDDGRGHVVWADLTLVHPL